MLQVSLLTENGNTKDDLRLPTDDSLLTQASDLVFSLSDMLEQVFLFVLSLNLSIPPTSIYYKCKQNLHLAGTV